METIAVSLVAGIWLMVCLGTVMAVYVTYELSREHSYEDRVDLWITLVCCLFGIIYGLVTLYL